MNRFLLKLFQVGSFFLFFFSWRLILAESQVIVLSAEGAYPLVYAHVTFTNLDISPSASQTVLTGEDGVAVSPFSGSVSVHITYTGFRPLDDTLQSNEIKTYRLEEQAFEIGDVVVTAQYDPGSAEKSVHKIEIIGREEIDLKAATTLKDLLSDQGNIRLSQDNILGSSLSLEGISGQNVKILIDGVPVIGRLNGNIDISQINLNDIERVEIVKGPLSVNYGTNALAGTINLITKKGQQDRWDTYATGYYESVGQYNFDAGTGYQQNHSRISLSGGRNFFDGWSLVDTSRHKDWKPKEQYFADAGYAFTSEKLHLALGSRYFRELITNRGLRRKPYYETAFDDYYFTQRLDNQLSLQYRPNEKGNFGLQIAYNTYQRIKNTYFKDLVTLGEVLTANPGDQDTSFFSLFMARGSYINTKPDNKLHYELGFDLNYEQAAGLRINDGRQTIGDYAVFATSEIKPIESMTIRPGLRYAYNTDYRTPLIPSLNVRFGLSPKLTMRASYARGFRAPSLKELNFLFVDINHNIHGNPDLEAEKSNNYNLAFSYRKANKLTVYKAELSVYYNDIFNMITLAQQGGSIYSYVNIGRFRSLGGEASYSLIMENLQLKLGGGLIGRYNDISYSSSAPAVSTTPEIVADLSYHIKTLGVKIALFYKFTGRSPSFYIDENQILRENYIGSFQSADLTLTRPFWNNKIQLSTGAKNLFDVKDIQASVSGGAHSSAGGSLPMAWGRSIFAKLKIQL